MQKTTPAFVCSRNPVTFYGKTVECVHFCFDLFWFVSSYWCGEQGFLLRCSIMSVKTTNSLSMREKNFFSFTKVRLSLYSFSQQDLFVSLQSVIWEYPRVDGRDSDYWWHPARREEFLPTEHYECHSPAAEQRRQAQRKCRVSQISLLHAFALSFLFRFYQPLRNEAEAGCFHHVDCSRHTYAGKFEIYLILSSLIWRVVRCLQRLWRLGLCGRRMSPLVLSVLLKHTDALVRASTLHFIGNLTKMVAKVPRPYETNHFCCLEHGMAVPWQPILSEW